MPSWRPVVNYTERLSWHFDEFDGVGFRIKQCAGSFVALAVGRVFVTLDQLAGCVNQAKNVVVGVLKYPEEPLAEILLVGVLAAYGLIEGNFTLYFLPPRSALTTSK